MFKVYVIKPTEQYKSLFYKLCRAFKYNIQEIANIGKVNERENIVVFCPEVEDVKTVSLENFEHPKDAVYVFGTDIDGDVIKEIDDWMGDLKYKITYVSIPMAKDSVMSIWACSACAIALYDRFIKRKK